MSLMSCMGVQRHACPFEREKKIPSFVLHFPLVLTSEATRGHFPSVSWVKAVEGRVERSLYLHRAPGAHYPDNITHAQTALCGVFLLIALLNDLESFKTNSAFCV